MSHQSLVNITAQHMLDAINDQAAIIGTNGKVLMVNQAWSRFSSHISQAVRAVPGADYFSILEELGEHDLLSHIHSVLAGYSENCSYVAKCDENRQEQYTKITVSAIHDNNIMTGLLIRQSDNTSTIQNQYQLSDLMESMTDGFLAVGHDWEITYVNNEALRLLKSKRDFLLGKKVWEAFPKLVGSQFETGYTEALARQKTVRVEEYFTPRKMWFQVHFYPRTDGGMTIYFQSINKRKRMEEKLIHSAYYDELTGLPNKKMLQRTLTELIADEKEEARFLIFFVDVDGFKNINDLYGHHTGDLVLKRLGDRLKNATLEKDHFAARFGGDGFVAVYHTRADSGDDSRFAQNLLNQVSKPFKLDGHHEVSLTASIGVSKYPEDGKTVNDLLSMSDTAMYESKKLKGNQVTPYHYKMTEKLVNRITLLEKLKMAIINHDLDYVYQPMVDIENRSICGIEVLTRWFDPEAGYVSPGDFIPLAEESGLIRKITENQILAVFPYINDWRNETGYTGTLSVNLSTSLLETSDFIHFFTEQMAKHHIPSGVIELELTESIQLFTNPEIIRHLKMLKKHGVTIAIDDFGTGYSNFAYLSELPLDKVKIDMSFVHHIGENQRVEKILASLIQLSKTLGYACVAEGVETEAQLEFLGRHACGFVQGYYFYRPLSADNLFTILKNEPAD